MAEGTSVDPGPSSDTRADKSSGLTQPPAFLLACIPTDTRSDKSRGLSSEQAQEIKKLRTLALNVCFYLVLVMLAAFFGGVALLGKVKADEPPQVIFLRLMTPLIGEPPKVIFLAIVAQALIGASGSAIAALTSCLERYANGYELAGEKGEKSEKFPKAQSKDDDRKEMFSRRMARWFIFRPFLGTVIAPVFIWGMEYFVNEPAKFTSSPAKIGFSAFMGGLLAKSVIDLIKGLFKNIFKA